MADLVRLVGLDAQRAKVSAAIDSLYQFTAEAGSPEMRAVQCALECLGSAYAVLSGAAPDDGEDV